MHHCAGEHQATAKTQSKLVFLWEEDLTFNTLPTLGHCSITGANRIQVAQGHLNSS